MYCLSAKCCDRNIWLQLLLGVLSDSTRNGSDTARCVYVYVSQIILFVISSISFDAAEIPAKIQ